jgi:hypothetical protein
MNRSPGLQRKIIMPALAAALLAVPVSNCASIDTPAAKLQALWTVGIVSAIGDEFTLTNAGLTGFTDSDQRFSIQPWGIDDLIVRRTAALLGKHFQVQPVTYRRASFAAREQDPPIAGMKMLRDDRIKELVRTQVLPQGLDGYLTITKATSTYGSRSRTVTGLGIIRTGAMFGSYAELYALYEIRLIDGHKFEVIDKRPAIPLNSDEMVRLAGPSRLIDDTLLPTANEPERNEQLKGALTDLVERSLVATLQDLRLD